MRSIMCAYLVGFSVLGVTLFACGGEGDSGSNAGPVAALNIVSGDAQVGVAGEELPSAVTVRVTDSKDAPLPGQIINFHVVDGGGTVFGGAAISDSDGVARERWTLGPTAGPQTLEAHAVTSDTGEPLVFARFVATALPGPASAVTIVSGAGQIAQQFTALPEPVFVRVADRFGNRISGIQVSFVPAAGCGSTTPSETATGVSGEASATWTLGETLGEQTLEIRVTGVPPTSVSATATTFIPRGVPGGVVAVSPTGELPSPHRSFPVNARVLDGYGDPVSGVAVDFVPAPGGGSATPATVLTDASGDAVSTWTHGTVAGQETLEARVAGLAPAVFSHAVAEGEVFDGVYAGGASDAICTTPTGSEPCSYCNNVAFTVSEGDIVSAVCAIDWSSITNPAYVQLPKTVAADGLFSFSFGSIQRNRCTGTFYVDPAGQGSASGTLETPYPNDFDTGAIYYCRATWTATRQ